MYALGLPLIKDSKLLVGVYMNLNKHFPRHWLNFLSFIRQCSPAIWWKFFIFWKSTEDLDQNTVKKQNQAIAHIDWHICKITYSSTINLYINWNCLMLPNETLIHEVV